MLNNNQILFHSLTNEHHDEFIKKLFKYYSLINSVNKYGETLLHYCAFYGLIEQYYSLINIGAEIKKTNDGNNLLHYATVSGKDDFLVTELVKQGISPLETNKKNRTALHLAENERIAHYLNMWSLRNNCDIIKLLDIDNNTIAHSCKIHGNIDGANYWINHYPELNNLKNIYNQSWKQCKKKNQQTGLF